MPNRTVVVYLTRHAEPDVLSGKRFLGQADPPLGCRGEEQARRLAVCLTGAESVRRGLPPSHYPFTSLFDAVYTSDLCRSLQTAQIVVGTSGIPVFPLPEFREINTGLWENLTFEEVASLHSADYAAREKDLIGFRFPGGESFRDLQARVVPAFLDLVRKSSEVGQKVLLVVGHKGPNRVLLCHFLGLPLKRLFSLRQDYCALAILEIPADQAGSEHALRVGESAPANSVPSPVGRTLTISHGMLMELEGHGAPEGGLRKPADGSTFSR